MITDQQRAELKARIDAVSMAHVAWQASLALMMATPGAAVKETKESIRSARKCDTLRAELKAWIDKEL